MPIKSLMSKLAATVVLLAITVCAFGQYEYLPEEMIVSASSLKLRSEASINSSVVETLPKGTLLKVSGTFNNGEVIEVNEMYAPWYKVITPSGKMGFVFGAYVAPTMGLYYEDEIFEGAIPSLNWYGVYRRDSFSDELRKIDVTAKKTYSEMYEMEVQLLKTNQKDTSKFIIGTTSVFKTGYAGPLGIMDSPGWFFEGGLTPGAMVSVSSGQPPGDTVYGQTLFLAATGCASLKDGYVQVSNYKVQLLEILSESGNKIQDITQWLNYMPDLNPSVQLLWYGDIDQDKLPDFVLHDCPVEMGCRSSLFLSSKAAPGELVKKVCEHFWYGD